MTFRAYLHPNARRDRDRILAWFDQEYPAQAERFLDDFYQGLRWIERNPLLLREIRPGIRHVSLAVFAYHLWYRIHAEPELVEVFAVLHHRADRSELDRRLSW